jgi:hypothetical protein
LEEKVAALSTKSRLMTMGIRCPDHATPSIRKSWHYFANKRGRSVGIVRSRTKATEFSLVRSKSSSYIIELVGVFVQMREQTVTYLYIVNIIFRHISNMQIEYCTNYLDNKKVLGPTWNLSTQTILHS